MSCGTSTPTPSWLPLRPDHPSSVPIREIVDNRTRCYPRPVAAPDHPTIIAVLLGANGQRPPGWTPVRARADAALHRRGRAGRRGRRRRRAVALGLLLHRAARRVAPGRRAALGARRRGRRRHAAVRRAGRLRRGRHQRPRRLRPADGRVRAGLDPGPGQAAARDPRPAARPAVAAPGDRDAGRPGGAGGRHRRRSGGPPPGCCARSACGCAGPAAPRAPTTPTSAPCWPATGWPSTWAGPITSWWSRRSPRQTRGLIDAAVLARDEADRAPGQPRPRPDRRRGRAAGRAARGPARGRVAGRVRHRAAAGRPSAVDGAGGGRLPAPVRRRGRLAGRRWPGSSSTTRCASWTGRRCTTWWTSGSGSSRRTGDPRSATPRSDRDRARPGCTAHRAGRRLPDRAALPGRGHPGRAGRDRRARPGGERVRAGRRGRRAGRGPGSRSGAGGPGAPLGAGRRRADLDQGPAAHRGLADAARQHG